MRDGEAAGLAGDKTGDATGGYLCRHLEGELDRSLCSRGVVALVGGGKHVTKFDITGRSRKGWLMVGPAAIRTSAGLGRWLKIARNFARSLPPK